MCPRERHVRFSKQAAVGQCVEASPSDRKRAACASQSRLCHSLELLFYLCRLFTLRVPFVVFALGALLPIATIRISLSIHRHPLVSTTATSSSTNFWSGSKCPHWPLIKTLATSGRRPKYRLHMCKYVLPRLATVSLVNDSIIDSVCHTPRPLATLSTGGPCWPWCNMPVSHFHDYLSAAVRLESDSSHLFE